MAEDIIITPGSGKIDFYDLVGNDFIWIIESGSLNFKNGGITRLAMNNTSPMFRVTLADLKLITSLNNNSGMLINTSGWQGARQPTGPIGAQGAQGTQGAQGAQGFQGNQGPCAPCEPVAPIGP